MKIKKKLQSNRCNYAKTIRFTTEKCLKKIQMEWSADMIRLLLKKQSKLSLSLFACLSKNLSHLGIKMF